MAEPDPECQRRIFRVVPVATLEALGSKPLVTCRDGMTSTVLQFDAETPRDFDTPWMTLGFAWDNDQTFPTVRDIDGSYGRIYYKGAFTRFREEVAKHQQAIQNIPGCRISSGSKMKKTIDIGFRCRDMEVAEFKRTLKFLEGALKE